MKFCLKCETSFVATTWSCPKCGAQPQEIGGWLSFAPDLASDAGYKDSFFDELVDLEANNFWFRARNKLIVWALKRYFAGANQFLEIGCGTGFVLSGVGASLPELVLSGSEISTEGLAHAAHRVPGVNLFQMDARAIPFNNEFDVIGAFDVIEHIEEDDVVLSQMHQAVRPGGGILLTVPQHEFLWSAVDEHACHVRRYAAKDLVSKVRAADFKVVRMTSFVSLLLPLMFASRAMQSSRKEEYDPLGELRMNRFANAVLEKVAQVESMGIRAGLNFPAGGSLLLIARKIS